MIAYSRFTGLSQQLFVAKVFTHLSYRAIPDWVEILTAYLKKASIERKNASNKFFSYTVCAHFQKMYTFCQPTKKLCTLNINTASTNPNRLVRRKLKLSAIAPINKKEKIEKMQINKKIYTTLIITVLTISMVLMALPTTVFAASLSIDTITATTGSPGTRVTITGTSETTGGEMVLYWDQVKVWDGTKGELARAYASINAYTIVFYVPEVVAGKHQIIVDDASSDLAPVALEFTVSAGIRLTPRVGLAGDTITVTGNGFNPNEYISMTYWNGTTNLDLTTSPLMPKTDAKGSVSCTFVIPADATNKADNIYAEDETGESATATLDIGPYITLTPDSGVIGSTVQVAGRGFAPNKVVDIEWLIDSEYVTVIDNAPIDATGSFIVTMTVPLLPNPTAPGNDYTIRAIDTAPSPTVELDTFTLIKEDSIKLTPAAGKVASSVTVTGTWFSVSKTVTVTFDGTQVATATTDGFGTFTATFAVPEVALGAYTVTATDSKGVTDSATFTVIVDVFMVATRATEYTRMDFLSITSQATAKTGVDLVITDPNGLRYIKDTVTEGSWVPVGTFWYIPYDVTDIPWWPLTADAPLGTWNFTCYAAGTTTILDTNLFTVVDRATQQDVLDKLVTMEASIKGAVTTSEGKILVRINSKAGDIMMDIAALDPQITALTDSVVVLATMIGEVQVDIAALDLGTMGVDITSIKGDVATIKTNLGTVKTAVSNLDAKVTSVSGDIATVSTKLGTLEGKITAIEGTTATIKTDVGTVQADISDVSAKIDTTPALIAVVLSLIAAIAAVFAVITIRQKIAG